MWRQFQNKFQDILKSVLGQQSSRQNSEDDIRKRPGYKLFQLTANLMGTSVGPALPEYAGNPSIEELLSGKARPPVLNLEQELLRHNVSIAELAIISGLVKGDKAQQDMILDRVRPEHLREKSFQRYLFETATRYYNELGKVPILEVQASISGFSPTVRNEPNGEEDLRADYFQWVQILELAPTFSQIERAIELITSSQKQD